VAVTLRLARHGMKKRPFYRIVATERLSRRDGRFLEVVGTYNPMTQPAAVTLKEERVSKWLEVGAQTTEQVASLIKAHMPGKLEAIETGRRNKIQAQRRKRKERAVARS
jgi:small subunit ribosomal protein S16